MRFRHAMATIVALTLVGSTLAQGSANHEVNVSIPTVLRMRVDQNAARDHAHVPVNVRIDGARREIDPASTQLEVFANTAWQLSVSYVAVGDGSTLVLSWHTASSSGVLQSSPAIVTGGTATGGWRRVLVDYGVVDEPADGTYEGVIAFTLARP